MSSELPDMWGLFCNILSVPQNEIMDMKIVMILKYDNVIISVSSEKIRHIEVNFYAVRSLKTLILFYIYILRPYLIIFIIFIVIIHYVQEFTRSTMSNKMPSEFQSRVQVFSTTTPIYCYREITATRQRR